MQPNKTWYLSKTLWVNMVALIASALAAFGFDFGLDAQGQASLVGLIMSGVNIVLRLNTVQGIAS